MPGQIEVGDTFTHDTAPRKHLIAVSIDDAGWIHDDGGFPNNPMYCHLVRKAAKDPYAGLTLPTPPAGYRLAKWGEELPKGTQCWDCDESGKNGTWDNDWCWHWPWKGWDDCNKDAWNFIFAVHIDQPTSTAPKSWQFRHDPWTPPQPKTLADCVEDTPVVVRNMRGEWIVVYRIGTQAFNQGTGEYLAEAGNLKFVRYLDPPQPAPLRIEDVPDCRCIQVPGNINHYWRHQGNWHEYIPCGGWIRSSARAAEFTELTVTDYVAEFK